jgi:hypothetical protein
VTAGRISIKAIRSIFLLIKARRDYGLTAGRVDAVVVTLLPDGGQLMRVRMRMRIHVIATVVAVSCPVLFGQSPQRSSETKSIDQYIPAVVQAVEDEIYDYNDENKYFLIDDQGAGDTKPAKISIYISKEISNDGDGVAIYKLMPYGEVYRLFVVQKDGLVVLLGDPEKRFPPTGGSVLTVYMTDDKVCSFIQQRATKSYFTVDPSVSKTRLNEAVQRQLKRVGFSYRQYAAKHAQKK